MRGDRPRLAYIRWVSMRFTPHARGSTLHASGGILQDEVYPACAGIDPVTFTDLYHALRLPRMRGDRPIPEKVCLWLPEFTPHARGSTCSAFRCSMSSCVYPACAGIDLCSDDRNPRQPCLPRMRGDRPQNKWRGILPSPFTPHARGSTLGQGRQRLFLCVYPACAGIDPDKDGMLYSNTCLPRMRGDRPDYLRDYVFDVLFTPHARGSTARREIKGGVA